MLDPVALMLQLCQTILLPTFIGASIRGLVPGGWLLNLPALGCANGASFCIAGGTEQCGGMLHCLKCVTSRL
jgi:hypothetical protein